jgi:hypothetical protein
MLGGREDKVVLGTDKRATARRQNLRESLLYKNDNKSTVCDDRHQALKHVQLHVL